MQDAETGREREMVVSRQGADQVRARVRRFLSEVEGFAQGHEIRYVRVETNEKLERMVARIARGRILEVP
jgi:hypothetical protein